MERRRISRRLSIAAIVVVLVILGVVIYQFVYTPTITLHVVNDTSATVRITLCGSDPQVVQPGQVIAIDPNRHDPHAACVVYPGTGDQALGCLAVPTTRFNDGDTVRVSATVRGVPPDRCGD